MSLMAKASGYMIIIGISYFLKCIGILSPEDKGLLGKVLMYITLPCAFIANFQSFTSEWTLIYYFFIGLIANLLMILVAKIVARKRSPHDRALFMVEGSGYNIGAFTTPFVGSFLPVSSTVISSIFDIGNSLICVGGIYPLAVGVIHEGKEGRVIYKFFKTLLKSVPFDTYIIMLLISLMGIRLPESVNQIAAMIGAPSIIITMIMIGITFEIQVSREDVFDILKILTIRYGSAFILGWFILNHMPFDDLAKKVILICLFAPVTSISTTYCHMLSLRPKVYGAISSLTVPISMVAFMIILKLF